MTRNDIIIRGITLIGDKSYAAPSCTSAASSIISYCEGSVLEKSSRGKFAIFVHPTVKTSSSCLYQPRAVSCWTFSGLSIVSLQIFNLRQKMLFNLIFSLFSVFTAVTAEEYQLTSFDDKSPMILPLKSQVIPIPRPVYGQPLHVNISAHILRMIISTEKEEFEVSMYLRQEWIDPRLAFESPEPWIYKEIENFKSIWTPDIFFVNEVTRKSCVGEKGTSFLRRYPDGRVFTSQRMTLTASCPMHLRTYPFDIQTCELQIESYGYTMDDMIIEWNTSTEYPVTGDLISSEFLGAVKWESSVTRFRGITYSSPRIEFNLTRTPTAVIFRVIIPITLITIFSWTSFFFSRNEVGVRLTLCISPIITYLLQMNFSKTFFIAPGYLTGLDIWAGISFIAMLAAFLECILVMYRKDGKSNYTDEESEIIDRRARIIFAFFVISFDVLCLVCIYLTRNL